MRAQLLGLDPATYAPHPLHAAPRTYTETNCFTDIVVELLHARGDEPLAMLGCTFRLDFEGDQFTFFKPDPRDLEELYGVDIHEMQPYRPLPQQLVEALARGRTMTIELDSWYLPDVTATAYRKAHVKSSVVVEGIDPEAERLRYFHNAGLYDLEGEDYRGVFRLGRLSDDVLPPYTELVRFDAGPGLDDAGRRAYALERLPQHVERGPRDNPFARFAESLEEELPRLLEGSMEDYHAYAFATVRIAGSGYELASAHVEWLLGADHPAKAACDRIVEGCKLLGFRLARRKPFDAAPIVDDLVDAWDTARGALFASAR